MRTQKSFQVEAIVNKYKNLASNTEKVKEIRELLDLGFAAVGGHLEFVEQLIGYIYTRYAGDSAIQDVLNEYSEYTSYYIHGLLDEAEEQFLVDNFDIFIDYVFDNFDTVVNWGRQFDQPQTWSRLVPYLLNKDSKAIFIANSDNGREFTGLVDCDFTVQYGYVNAAIRAQANNQVIHSYNTEVSTDDEFWKDIKDGQFDAVIVEASDAGLLLSENLVENCYNECNRIVRDGGEILLCVSKAAIMTKWTASLRRDLVKNKTLQEVIQLPNGNILLHIVKRPHDTFVMYDATSITLKGKDRIIDIDAFQKEIALADMPEREDKPIVRRFSYDKLNHDILLPAYYLLAKNTGKPIECFVDIVTDKVKYDKCLPGEKVVKISDLSFMFSKGNFKIDELQDVNLDRYRAYSRVDGAAVIMAVSEKNIAIGYTLDNSSYLVPAHLYALKPQKGIDVKYLAAKLLSKELQTQICMLAYDDSIPSDTLCVLAPNWEKLIIADFPSLKEQQDFIQETIMNDFTAQENFAINQEKGFKHAIRLRKHALSQNISAFDSLYSSLEYCISESKGQIKVSDRLSPVSSITVGDAIKKMRSDLDIICERVDHLIDDQDWGKCEVIEPQQFIEDYERKYKSIKFEYINGWRDWEKNYFEKDWIHKESGRVVFYKGEAWRSVWFPPRALRQVFDNIISNACEHGFKDKSRNDYKIKMSLEVDGLNVIIKISNNGAPLASDINSDLVLEYGYSTELNHNGHAEIGGGEIAEIMRKYNGCVRVISNPEDAFPVTYELTLPFGSTY